MASTAGHRAAASESAPPENMRRRLQLLPVRPQRSHSPAPSAPRRLKKAMPARLRSAPQIGCGTLDALADFFLVSSPRRVREGCPELLRRERCVAADQWRGNAEQSSGLIDSVRSRTGPRGRSTTTAGVTTSLTDEEFHQLIYTKLRTASHGLKSLFKAHDPTGNGAVSAAAFKKILFALCGYVCPAQFDKLLRRMNAEGSRAITFEVLASCFDGCRVRQQDGNKEWLTWQGPLATSDGGQRKPHFVLGDAELHKRIRESPVTTPQLQETTPKLKRASYVLTIMKKFIRERQPEAVNILNSALDDKRPILKYHLKDFTERVLAMPMNAKELHKLWMRFDQSGAGAITATQLLSRLGLKSYSRFKIRVPDSFTENDDGAKAGCDKHAEASVDAHRDSTNLDHFGPKSTTTEQRHSLVDSASSSIINTAGDVLRSFDARLREFIEILWTEDSMKTNIIALPTFQKKLGEFILHEIDDYNIRQIIINAGAMTADENVDYCRLLKYVYGMRRIFCREDIVPQRFNNDGCFKEDAPTLHKNSLELRLLRYFHGSFIDLVDRLRKADKTNTGLLPSSIVKNILEDVTGVRIVDGPWSELHFALTQHISNSVSDVPLMDYSMLLQALVACGSTWWTKESTCFRKSRPSHIKIKVPLLSTNRKDTEISSGTILKDHLPFMPRQLPLERPPRSVEELSAVVKNLVSTKFYVLDQAYRSEDRKYTGRIGIETLHRILKAAQEELTWPEMTALWSSLDRAPDGMYTWSRFCHKFMDKDTKVRTQPKPVHTGQVAASGNAHATIENGDNGEQSRAANGLSTVSLVMLLDRLSPSAVESMKRSLENADQTHSGFVSTADAKKVFVDNHLPLSDADYDKLFRKFTTTQPGGFAYKHFLDAYATHAASINKDRTKASNSSSQGNVRMSAALRSSLALRLAGQQKLFKRACKALDRQGNGHLNIADLRAAMDQVNIRLSEEDIFVLFNEHDKKLTGRIDYKGLISSLLGSSQ